MSQTQLPEIFLHDTLAGAKRTLETIEPGKVGIYCCGPTVYGLTHVGNARAAIVPDIIVRFLRHEGYEVRYVRNVTDIDDKIIRIAGQEGVPAADVAERFTAEYHRDMTDLKMLEPDVEPRVSGHLAEIIALVQDLVAKDLAYAVDGDVYYRVRAFGPYGRLSKRSVDEMIEGAGSRIDVDERKESPLDFALWKAAKPGEPAWDSPWGPGRPGWHIECSAMSSTHLGDTFDIHTGGRDLIFPHHENEIAQSQGAHGEGTFARHWIHNGFIDFDGEKMSKSLGNFFTTREITALYDAETVRYFLLTVHYRSGLNFEIELACPVCGHPMDRSEQETGACTACGATTPLDVLRSRVRFPGLEEADDRLAYVYTTLQRARAFLADGPAPAEGAQVLEHTDGMLAAFVAHMRNDFNTSGALGTLSRPLGEVNGLLDSGKGVAKDVRRATVARFVADFAEVAAILGCFDDEPEAWLTRRRDLKAARIGLDIARVEGLVAERSRAREARDWAEADSLRDELDALGVSVQDGPAGSAWTFA
jgi:cysteinyl-tRNA synthetase